MAKHAGARRAVNAMLAVSLGLAAAMSAASYALTVGPAREAARAQSWVAVPDIIVAASDHLEY